MAPSNVLRFSDATLNEGSFAQHSHVRSKLARHSHNLKVVSSNLTPAPNFKAIGSTDGLNF